VLARWVSGRSSTSIRRLSTARRISHSRIRDRVMLGILAVTTFIFGIVPVFAVQRFNMHSILKTGSKTATAPPRRLRARTILAAAQLALAVALLTGAG